MRKNSFYIFGMASQLGRGMVTFIKCCPLTKVTKMKRKRPSKLKQILLTGAMVASSILPNLSAHAQSTNLPTNINHPMYGLNYFVPAHDVDFATNKNFYGSGDVDGNGKIDMQDYNSTITGTDPFNDGTHRGDTDLDGISGTFADKQIILEYIQGTRTHINIWELETKPEQENHLERALAIDPTNLIGPSSGWECYDYSDQLATINFNGVYDITNSIFNENNGTNLQFDLTHNGIFRIPARRLSTVSTTGVPHQINFVYISDKDNENVKDLNKKRKIEPQNDVTFDVNNNVPSLNPNKYANETWYGYLNPSFFETTYTTLRLGEYNLNNGIATLTDFYDQIPQSFNPFNDNGVEGKTITYPASRTLEYTPNVLNEAAQIIEDSEVTGILYTDYTDVSRTTTNNQDPNPNNPGYYNFKIGNTDHAKAGKYEDEGYWEISIADTQPPIYNQTSKTFSDASGSPVTVTLRKDTTNRSCDGLVGKAREFKKGTDASGNALEVLTSENPFDNRIMPTYSSAPADVEYVGNPNDANPTPDLTGAPVWSHPESNVVMHYTDETVRESYGEKDIKRTFNGTTERSNCEYSTDTTQMIYVRSGVGTGDSQAKTEISIYPNPAKEYIRMNWDGFPTWGRHPITFEVIDLTGRIIFEKEISSRDFEINTSAYQTGIYIIKIINSNQIITTQKIVIQK